MVRPGRRLSLAERSTTSATASPPGIPGQCHGRTYAHPIRAGLADGGCKGESEISPLARWVRGARKLRRSQSNRDDGWSGCRGTKALTGDATARRCTGVMRLDAEAAPAAGGIQQGAARSPLARWSGRRTDLVLDVVQNTSCAQRLRTRTTTDVVHPWLQSCGVDRPARSSAQRDTAMLTRCRVWIVLIYSSWRVI